MKYIFYLLLILFFFDGCLDDKDKKDNIDNGLELIWSFDYEIKNSGPWTYPAIIGDSLIIMTGDEYISCLYIDNGVIKWKFLVPGGSLSSIRNILFDNENFYGWQENYNNQVYTVNINTGEKIWSIDSIGFLRYHGLSNEYYYSTYYNKIFKVSKSGNVMNTITNSIDFRSISYYNEKIYGGQGWPNGFHDSGRLICYDESTLDSLWSFDSPGGGFNMCYPVFDKGFLYSGTVWGNNNKVISLNAETGSVNWEVGTTGCYQIILNDNHLFYRDGAGLNALDKSSGQLLWNTVFPTTDQTSPFTYWDDYIYKAHWGNLFILNATTGEIVFQTKGPDDASVLQVAAGAGMIFVQSSQHLYALEPYSE